MDFAVHALVGKAHVGDGLAGHHAYDDPVRLPRRDKEAAGRGERHHLVERVHVDLAAVNLEYTAVSVHYFSVLLFLKLVTVVLVAHP